MKRLSMRGGNKVLWSAVLLLLLATSPARSQTGWYAVGGVQVNGGRFGADAYTHVYSISPGLRYQGSDFGVTIILPLVSSNHVLSQSNGGTMPSGMNPSLGSRMPATGMHLGVGDMVAYADYRLFSDEMSALAIYLNAQVKAPTSSNDENLGTGKWDVGASITMRKGFDDFVTFVDAGYLDIGDPEGITYSNPLTFGVGVGKFFGQGKHSVLIYYNGYTKVLDAYDLPQQLSLGGNVRLSNEIILSIIVSKGIGNSAPDFTLNSGVRIRF